MPTLRSGKKLFISTSPSLLLELDDGMDDETNDVDFIDVPKVCFSK